MREETTSLLINTLDGTHVHLENKHLSRSFYWFLWIMYAFVYMTKSCFTASMASMVSEGILTKTQTGTINAAFYLVYGPLQILGGLMADKYNPYRMIKLSLVGGALANAIIYIWPCYPVMLGAWCFNAVAQFTLWPATFKLISSQLVRSDRRMMTFYISFGTTAGMFMSYLVAAIVSRWQYNFLLSAGVLLAFALMLAIVYRKRILPKLKVDRDVYISKAGIIKFHHERKSGGSAVKLFLKSGFFVMCLLVFCRVAIDNGIKTLSPTMLMETYSVSPSFGNALGLIVIVAGVVGMLVVGVVFPKFVKNELALHAAMMIVAIPFSVALQNMAKAGMIGSVVSMCAISALFTAMRTLAYNYNLRFAEYGKSGTAAGISNAAESLAITVQSYAFTKMADVAGWSPVMTTCVAVTIVAVVLNFAVIFMWKRFSKTGLN